MAHNFTKKSHLIDPSLSILANAERSILACLDEMLKYETYMADPAAVTQLHQLRIEAKNLRYTLEIFVDLYRKYTRVAGQIEETISAVKVLQDHLGEIHDADVLLPQLADHLTRILHEGFGKDRRGESVVGVHLIDLDGCEGILTLCRETQDRRDRRYEQLLEEWGRNQERQLFLKLRLSLVEATYSPMVVPEAVSTSPPKTQNVVVVEEHVVAQNASEANGAVAEAHRLTASAGVAVPTVGDDAVGTDVVDSEIRSGLTAESESANLNSVTQNTVDPVPAQMGVRRDVLPRPSARRERAMKKDNSTNEEEPVDTARSAGNHPLARPSASASKSRRAARARPNQDSGPA